MIQLSQDTCLPLSLYPQAVTDASGLDPVTIGALARRAVIDMGKGTAYGTKAVLQPRDEEMLPLVGRTVAELFPDDERLNWKLNALVSANARYCAVKIVGSNAFNRVAGKPRSQSLIVLYDKLTMMPVAQFNGTGISARRTGAYASIVVDLALAHKTGLSICLYGAGPIADCVIDDLHAHHAGRIRCIHIRSRRQESAVSFAAAAATRTGLDIRAAGPADLQVDMVITATNAGWPIVAPELLVGEVVVLHLGGDELPVPFIERALAVGSIICDDVASVCQRNSQSLPLYFSRQGLRLRDLAGFFRIHSLHDHAALSAAPQRRPTLVTCVGLPVLDLYLAQWLHEQQADTDQAKKDTAG